jgi:predicted metal-binding membrane protein
VTASSSVERAVPAAALAAVAAAWVAAVRQMQGMDLGVSTRLEPFSFFVGIWVLMTMAMMLPGAVPAMSRRARADGIVAVLRFVGSYLAVWTLVGLAIYVAYRPHGDAIAAAVIVAAGVYELTPLKRKCRRRCREGFRSGLRFGVCCVGSSIGLMATLAAIGLMNITWSAVVAVLISAQKLFPPRALMDVALALGLLTFGIVVAV